MNTEYLKEFLILAETRNYWEAAERLFMNQSTLSKHIRALEMELDTPLFVRTTRKVELTEYGESLYPYAQNIVKSEFDIRSLFIQMKNSRNGSLNLGTIPTMAQYHIINLLHDFKQRCPKSKVSILEADSNDLKEALYSGHCELVFQREARLNFEKNFLKDEDVERIPYIQDHMVAVLPKQHPLAAKESLRLQELKNERFCLIKEGSLMYELCTSACQAAGFIPEIVFSTHRIHNILDVIVSDNCIALLMNNHILYSVENMSAREVPFVVIDILPKIRSQISLCYLKGVKLSAAAQQFIEYFKEHCINRQKQER